MKKTLSLLLSLVLMLSLALPASAAETEYPTLEGGVTEIQKYGNIVLDIDPADLKDGGYTYGDLLTVTVNGTGYDMPLCTNYSDVDTGALVLRDSEGVLIAAINMGDFATSNGLAAKVTAEDGSYTWEFPEGQSLESITVSISMKEQGGYYDQYLIHQLTRTDERADYASDAVFANFRNVAVGDLGENAFFRSSSPVNNELGRASYADDLAEAGGIQAVMNLADSNELIEGYIAAEGFDSPYYQSLYEAGKVKALNLGVDFTAADFKSGLAEGLRFFAENEGPYLVHCTEGKDRAGFVSALLECLMGATYDEVVADYMTTYVNYYHLEEGSEQYEAVKNSNIVSILTNITGAAEGTDLTTVDLAAAAEDYMLDAGLTADEVMNYEQNGGYNPMDIFNNDPQIRRVLMQLTNGYYSPKEPQLFKEIYDSLLNNCGGSRPDTYFILKDFRSYAEAHEKIDKAYRDRQWWAKAALINVSHSGKFTSDRTIEEYVRDIWHLKKVTLEQ